MRQLFRSFLSFAIALCTMIYGLSTSALAQSQGSRASQHKQGTRADAVVLNSSLTILESADSSSPIRHAAEDLAADFGKVFGTKPRIIYSEEDAAPVTILIGERSKIPESVRPAGSDAPESFSISIAKANWNKLRATDLIVLSGADMRGTIYAIYEFSQKYLGIDPLYYWTDHEPLRRASVSIPATTSEGFAAPVFKYRGFFINDEDLLTGWAPGEKKDKTGILLEVWDHIFETILRLKGNIVAPGTWIFPDEPQVKFAAQRGLIVTQHHAIPLGLNVARWPKDVTYNYTTNPEILERAWNNAAKSYLPDQEVLWSVGLRGLSDVTYASMDPSVRDNNKALGELISKAIAAQIRIVRSVRPQAQFVTNLWQEGARLVQQGDLKIPPEVATVWADDGYGYLQDNGQVTAGQGIYDHVAMMNGRANQLTEMVPIERSLSEIGRYIKAGATHYYLVNTSDIRPVTMSIRAVMDATWRGLPGDGDKTSVDFYRRWSAEEFGDKAAAHLAELYQEYFKAPAHFGEPTREYGDQLYHTEARRMLLSYMTDAPLYSVPSQAPKWQSPRVLLPGAELGPSRAAGKEWLVQIIPHEIQQCGEAQPRWDALWKKALEIEPLVPASRKPFYQAAVLTMIAVNRESNRMLLQISKAIRDAQNGNITEARQEVQQALASFDEIQRAESAAEYGKWNHWYRGDWLTNVYRTRELVRTFANFLNDPETRLVPPLIWDGWEAYYHIMHYEGDRSADVN